MAVADTCCCRLGMEHAEDTSVAGLSAAHPIVAALTNGFGIRRLHYHFRTPLYQAQSPGHFLLRNAPSVEHNEA